MNMNWDDPSQRLDLIERVGADEYNRLHAEYVERSTVKKVGKYSIRPIHSNHFGRIYMIDTTDGAAGVGFRTIAECEAWIAKQS